MRSRRVAPLAVIAALVGAGALWAAGPASAASTPLAGSSVFALASFDGQLWAGTDSGLYVLSGAGSGSGSGSGAGSGASWTAVGGAFAGREVNALAVAGGWLVAGTQDGAVRTRDGSAWVGAGLGGQRVVSLSASGATLLAGTGHDSPSDGVVERSDDFGGTWTPAATTPALLGLPGDTVQAVLVPAGSSPAWAGTAGGGAFRSGDGRGGWSSTSGMRSSWVTAFWRDPASGQLLAGSDDGLYIWSGSAWSAASFPQPDPWVEALDTGPDGHAVAGTYDGGVYAQGAGGGWTLRASGLPSVLSILAVAGGGLLVGTTDGLSCVSCPAGVAAAPATPGARRSDAAPSLPPPSARAGAQARGPGGASAPSSPRSGGASFDAHARSALAGTAGASGSSSGGSGSALRWLLVGGLVALSAGLFVVGRRRARRAAGSG
jgi:hypothetical protein